MRAKEPTAEMFMYFAETWRTAEDTAWRRQTGRIVPACLAPIPKAFLWKQHTLCSPQPWGHKLSLFCAREVQILKPSEKTYCRERKRKR